MEETPITDEEILQELQTEGEIEIDQICINCTHNLINLILKHFTEADFSLSQISDDLYHLVIIVGEH